MSITPPVIRSEAWSDDDAERVLLFSIVRSVDGEDVTVEYTMPDGQNAGLALLYLRQARKTGEDLAGSWLLEEVLGADGYEALAREPGVSLATVRQVSLGVLSVVFGRKIGKPADTEDAGAGDPLA